MNTASSCSLQTLDLDLRSCLKPGAEEITVILRTVTNLNYYVRVKETDKVQHLRTQLYETADLKHKFRLVHQKEVLEDDKRLDTYSVQDGSVVQILFISPETIEVDVHVFKKGNVWLKISDSDTPGDLRQLLKDPKLCLGSAPTVYDIFHRGEKLVEEHPLHFYGITNHSRIDVKCLDASFKVAIESSGAFKVVDFLEVKGTEHVGDVKRRMLKIIADVEEADLKLNDVVIFHNPKNCRQTYNELDCDKFTLNKYGVEPHDYLVYITYRIDSPCANIPDSHKLHHVHRVTPMESVQSFRLKLQDQLGIPFGKQRLTFRDIEKLSYGDRIESFHDIELHHDKSCDV